MLSRRFVWGVALILFSSAIGWIAIFLGGVLSVHYGALALKIGGWIYSLSWIPFGLGFFLAGKDGVRYSKELIAKIFKRNRPTSKH